MKRRYFVLTWVLFLCLALFLSKSTILYAMEYQDINKINTTYEYPIQPGTQAWFDIESVQERVDLCQIP